jgi:hypothetical protein
MILPYATTFIETYLKVQGTTRVFPITRSPGYVAPWRTCSILSTSKLMYADHPPSPSPHDSPPPNKRLELAGGPK